MAARTRTTAPLKPPVLAEVVAVGSHLVIGQYRVELPSGNWWWSDEIYVLHGWMPGEVEPSLELLRSRKHPDDRTRIIKAATDAIRAGRPFASGHRIVDGHGKARNVVVTGQAKRDNAGKVLSVAGYVVDATPVRREILEREANRAVTRAFVSAAVIEQAKGVLMGTRGVTDTVAAQILSENALRVGITLQEAAQQVMAQLSKGEGKLGESAQVAIETALAGLHEVARPRSHNAQLARRRETV